MKALDAIVREHERRFLRGDVHERPARPNPVYESVSHAPWDRRVKHPEPVRQQSWASRMKAAQTRANTRQVRDFVKQSDFLNREKARLQAAIEAAKARESAHLEQQRVLEQRLQQNADMVATWLDEFMAGKQLRRVRTDERSSGFRHVFTAGHCGPPGMLIAAVDVERSYLHGEVPIRIIELRAVAAADSYWKLAERHPLNG